MRESAYAGFRCAGLNLASPNALFEAMMARFIALAFLFSLTTLTPPFAQGRSDLSVIVIEYVGDSDKPISPIIIGHSKEGIDWYRKSVMSKIERDLALTDVVHHSLLAELIADTQRYRGSQPGPAKTSASVLVTLVTPKGRTVLRLDVQPALSLIELFEERCRNAKSLHSDLEHFRSRILPRK